MSRYGGCCCCCCCWSSGCEEAVTEWDARLREEGCGGARGDEVGETEAGREEADWRDGPGIMGSGTCNESILRCCVCGREDKRERQGRRERERERKRKRGSTTAEDGRTTIPLLACPPPLPSLQSRHSSLPSFRPHILFIFFLKSIRLAPPITP